MWCLLASYKKKKYDQIFFFPSLKSRGKEADLELDPDPLVRGMDLWIRILTKLSWIPNTASNTNILLGWNENLAIFAVAHWQLTYYTCTSGAQQLTFFGH
jgi:hypothetical protein